ncbi:hypothetical protein ACWM9A_10525 [Acetobacter pasteurianus]
MKKLFVYMLVGAGLVASSAYADGYNPFHPLGGINSATTVPQVYSDGSTGTLAQIGQMADGSVQQTDADQPNGYPKLDGNKMMNAAVGGNISSGTASAQYAASALRTTQSVMSDTYNLKSFGAAMDGSDADRAIIQQAYNTAPSDSTIIIPCGIWPGTTTDGAYPWSPTPTAGKHINWVSNCHTAYAPSWARVIDKPIGDGDISEMVINGGKYIEQKRDTGTSLLPMGGLSFENYSGDYPFAWGNVYADIPAYTIHAVNYDHERGSTKVTTGSVVGLHINLDSYGHNPWSSQDQAFKFTITKHGSNSGWNGEFENNDWSGHSYNYGLNPDADGKYWAQTGVEFNIDGNGPEQPECLYDPGMCSRIGQYISPTVHTINPYCASTSYTAHSDTNQGPGDMVMRSDANGVNAVWIAIVSGTTAATPPAQSLWPTTEGATVVDGTVTWQRGADYNYVLGTAIYANAPADTFESVNTLIASKFRTNNASIDLSGEQLTRTDAASIRLHADHMIDLSGNLTAAGKNQHRIGYSTPEDSFVYLVGSSVFAEFKADGTIWSLKGVRLAQRSRADILATVNPVEGLTAFSTDDHAQLTYRCPIDPTTGDSKCGWYAPQYASTPVTN